MPKFLDLPLNQILKTFTFLDLNSRFMMFHLNSIIAGYINILGKQLLKEADEKSGDKTTCKEIMDILIHYLKHDNKPPVRENGIYGDWLIGYKPDKIFGFFEQLLKRKNTSYNNRHSVYYLLRWLPHTHEVKDMYRILYEKIKNNEKLKARFFPMLVEKLNIEKKDIKKQEELIIKKMDRFLNQGNYSGVVATPSHEEIEEQACADLISQALPNKILKV